MSTILVLGGDGFCGWPTALRLARDGKRVVIVDNLSHRLIDGKLGVQSLTPIRPIEHRVNAANRLFGGGVAFERLDIAKSYPTMVQLFKTYQPEAIIHFAEQRAAPYSMRSPETKRYTVENNITGTHNVLCALVETGIDAHLVHLGTMGVYGYGATGGKIPEGYLTVNTDEGERLEILHPMSPGSVYHTTKCLDHLMFAFYAKNDGLRITDLHQGIVWGAETEETRMDDRLVNRFDYDGDYGTVLNRFLVQAVVGYPLTVHGTGGQTRAFIHIQDTVECIRLALENPPERGERVKVLNQMTECHRVRDLAKIVSGITGAEIAYTPNPRKEAPENDLLVANDLLLEMGLQPTTLEDGLLRDVTDVVERFRDRVDLSKIPCRSTWTRDQEPGVPRAGESAASSTSSSEQP